MHAENFTSGTLRHIYIKCTKWHT